MWAAASAGKLTGGQADDGILERGGVELAGGGVLEELFGA